MFVSFNTNKLKYVNFFKAGHFFFTQAKFEKYVSWLVVLAFVQHKRDFQSWAVLCTSVALHIHKFKITASGDLKNLENVSRRSCCTTEEELQARRERESQ